MIDRTKRNQRHLALAATAALALLIVGACTGAAATPVPATPSPAPSAAAMQVMGTGSFHDVDGKGTGKAELAALPDGTYEVIFEGFSVASKDHTNVILVSNADVAATADVDKTKILDLGALTGTEGDAGVQDPGGDGRIGHGRIPHGRHLGHRDGARRRGRPAHLVVAPGPAAQVPEMGSGSPVRPTMVSHSRPRSAALNRV